MTGSIAAEDAVSKDLKAENKRRAVTFKAQHGLIVAFFTLIFIFHALAIYLFCSGFLLSRLVLQTRSTCDISPIDAAHASQSGIDYPTGSRQNGCWHPKSFDKAVVIVIDALRYDFTIPSSLQKIKSGHIHHFHDALPILYDTATRHPERAFLRPFIADPPTTTLQRLKGLMTGTLPTFIDAGSNFAGTAIDEDNIVEQLHRAGKRVVHLGDDTWHALFPGLFEPNLTRAYESFNVWDLHTLDNGVNEHIFPLLEKSMRDQWDVIIGHYLGVDHAGHRYGPDHPAMNAKLQQMNKIIGRIIADVDDDTLLVVMGDHGMDVKGDHGGESDDEVQAALWMYSKRGIFGRTDAAYRAPPVTAKQRPVGQIDLVPTLSLLLGLPIPFNNLGQPIEEAFIGSGNYANLARVSRLTSHQIRRYQAEYAVARNVDPSAVSPTDVLWKAAFEAWQAVDWKRTGDDASIKEAFSTFSAYQARNLQICRDLWARFDVTAIIMGIITLTGSFLVVLMYAQAFRGERAALTPMLLVRGVVGLIMGAVAGGLSGTLTESAGLQYTAFGAGIGGIAAALLGFWPARESLYLPLPKTLWGGLSLLVTLLLCIGFAANSFTIWEDEQLLFLLSTFGLLMLGSSLGQADAQDRTLGAMNAVSFLVATRISSSSRLCREEQMPNCRPTYYASATSSTSASWQLAIPFAVASLLPWIVQRFYIRTKNYQGSAVIWIGIALRIGLALSALFWILDTADDAEWYPTVSKDLLKTARTTIAQVVLALTFAGGYATYIWASPFLNVKEEKAEAQVISKPINGADPDAPVLTTMSSAPQTRSKLIILGYANTQGSRYVLLPLVWLLALILVQKPMGQGTLALCAVSILNVLEIIDANNLRRSSLGPILLALLGCFYFFKTGHQAVLSSIQWESAFIPTKKIQYPLSPIMVILNTFGPQILCALAVPAIPLWKVPPKHPGVLGRAAGAMMTHVMFYTAIALATIIESAWLRRHLMLYRVFMPRMLVAIVVLLLVDVVAAFLAIFGLRWSLISVGDVFGWPEI